MLSDHSGFKLEISDEDLHRIFPNIQKQNNTFLNNSRVKGLKRECRKDF